MCYCADRNTSIVKQEQASTCTMKCPGISNEFCGGFGSPAEPIVGNAYHVQGDVLVVYSDLYKFIAKQNI